jgi:hypothetical protein
VGSGDLGLAAIGVRRHGNGFGVLVRRIICHARSVGRRDLQICEATQVRRCGWRRYTPCVL